MEMMTVKLLRLLLALAWSTVPSQGQNHYRPKPKDSAWGVRADGLRMTAWTNPATDQVFVAVRNFSNKQICFCDPPGINNFAVYARRNSAAPWQELQFRTPPQPVTLNALCEASTLKPNEEMPFYEWQNGVRQRKNYSYALDLREYSFPAEWSGTVQVKIVQYNIYCTDPINRGGEVESQTFEIRLPFPEEAAQR